MAEPKARAIASNKFAIASDEDQPPGARAKAASELIWLLEGDADVDRSSLVLAKAVVSRVIDDISHTHGLDWSDMDVDYWRYFDVSAIDRPQLSRSRAAVAAQILFDAGRNEEAIFFFDICLEEDPSAEEILLACYNLEVLGRRLRSIDLVERSLQLLESGRLTALSDDRFTGEYEHLTGHLLLLRGRFLPTEALGYEYLGVSRLASAARKDGAYIGCYTSSMAEYGDFLGTIGVCLDTLKHDAFHDLVGLDRTLVALEVLFYLAYSLMAIGELERARQCFDSFARSVSDLELNEARDHARLFLVKLDLKRRSLATTESRHLRAAHNNLQSLSFKAALSQPMAAECQRYMNLVSFLNDLTSYRDSPGQPQSALTKLSSSASALVVELVGVRPTLLQTANLQIIAYEGALEEARRLIEMIRMTLPEGCLASSSVVDARSSGALEAIDIEQAVTLIAEVKDPSVGTSFSLVEDPDHDLDRETALALATVILGIVASRRYLSEDEYIFGMVPCLESPAIKFQHPRYDLEAVL